MLPRLEFFQDHPGTFPEDRGCRVVVGVDATMGTLPDLHREICNQADAREDLDLLGKHLDENESRVTVGTPELGVLTLVVSAYLKKWWIDESEPDPQHHDIAFSIFGYRIGGVKSDDRSPGTATFKVHDAAAVLIERAVEALHR